MSAKKSKQFVSRGGEKLSFALSEFGVNPAGKVCVDLGCSTGGFTDALLQGGAEKIYAVDTAWGVLEWKLRQDSRVVVMEKTNALHVELPERCSLAVIDAGWTKQSKIIPKAIELLDVNGEIISLIKPHYEASKDKMIGGLLPISAHAEILESVLVDYEKIGCKIIAGPIPSPIKGSKGGNQEYLVHLLKS